MHRRSIFTLSLLLSLALLLGPLPLQSAAAQPAMTGGVLIHTVVPKKICVGDTITIQGAASITYMDDPTPPLAWLPVTWVKIQAQLGQVSPQEITQNNDGFYFSFTYKAQSPGTETITLTVNDGIAATQEQFQVEERCDYDAFLITIMHFQTQLDDELFESITHVSGTGTMRRDRQGSLFYQGDGIWHLEEIVLSKPSMCVEYYIPPLMMHGPFDLDGRLGEEGDSVDVIFSFRPNMEESFYHGESVCVDQEGEVVTGWGSAQGGDPSLASKIEATFPFGGGSQSVELKGAGMDMVRSAGTLNYTATLTLIPR